MTELTASQLVGEESGGGGGSGGGDIVGQLERAYERLQNDPQLQKMAMQVAEQNDIDLSPLFGGSGQTEAPQAEGIPTSQQAAAMPTGGSDGIAGAELSTDAMRELLDDIADYHPSGEDATIADLQNFADENPDIVQTAINMRF